MVKETNTEGNYKTYEYDIDDSITDVTYPSSTSSNVKGLKFTYNSDNVSNSISNTVYTYDKVGNRVKEVKDGKTTFYYIILG